MDKVDASGGGPQEPPFAPDPQLIARGRAKAPRLRVGGDAGAAPETGLRAVPEETAVALVFDGSTEAVMMATPCDLEDFAVGFSLTEGLIEDPGEILGLEVVEGELGVELRLWLAPSRAARASARRRRLFGPTGCGLCGIESLEAAASRPHRPPLSLEPLAPDEVFEAMRALGGAQSLGRETRAVHAAGFWRPGRGLLVAREDVGRHNALDKTLGALARSGTAPAGLLLLTSRVSIELVQKAVAVGAPALVAVSAPTALAVRAAEAAGLTLIAVAREDAFEVFAGAERLGLAPPA